MQSRLGGFAGVLVTCLCSSRAGAQVSVAVDPTTNAHWISPLVYGMNFASDAQITAGRIPLTRWGGNSTSRYNYQIDVTNTGFDWYFENTPGCWGTGCSPVPTDPQTNSGANTFLKDAQTNGIVALMTIPTLGYVAKSPPVYAQPLPCGCPKTAIANQDSFDPYDSNCGNCQSGGQFVSAPSPTTTTSMSITAQWAHDWVAYIVTQVGASNGQVIYELDNEPGLWNSTHWDVHPSPLSYDELWQRMSTYGAAIVQADPTALVAGFEEWGWPNYLCSSVDTATGGCSASSPDRAAHGGEELTAWILDQAHQYENQNGQRILHALDLHYYPQDSSGHPPQTTRSLWDPTYTDPSWINAQIQLIPRMHAWVDQHYPGTKIGISEYDWGNHNAAIGAVAYAEVLGIFGREGLDYATAWSPPLQTEIAFNAFQLYTNYDGAGAHFNPVSVAATVTGSGVQAYASVGQTQMTVALANETSSAIQVTVTFGNFQPGATARYWQLSGSALVRQPDITLSSGSAVVPMAATAIGMLVVDGTNPSGLPDGGQADAGTASRDGGSGADGGRVDGGRTGSDSGSAAPDAGSSSADAGNTGLGGQCGCSASEGGLLSLGALLALGLSSRRRVRACRDS